MLENLFTLLYPFTTGLAIDGLLAGEGPRALAPLVIVWGLHIVVGAVRQAYDTRVFAKVHAELATRIVMRQRAAGYGMAEIAARSVMARELVDFFEREIPTMATAVIGLVGGVAMLFFYDVVSGVIVASSSATPSGRAQSASGGRRTASLAVVTRPVAPVRRAAALMRAASRVR